MLIMGGRIFRFSLRVLSLGLLSLGLVVSGLVQEKTNKEQPSPQVQKQPAAEKPMGVKMREMEYEPLKRCPSEAPLPRTRNKRTDRIGGQVIRAKEGEKE